MATCSSVLTKEIPWAEKTGGLQSMGCKKVGHDLATTPHQQASTGQLCPMLWLFPTLFNIQNFSTWGSWYSHKDMQSPTSDPFSYFEESDRAHLSDCWPLLPSRRCSLSSSPYLSGSMVIQILLFLRTVSRHLIFLKLMEGQRDA